MQKKPKKQMGQFKSVHNVMTVNGVQNNNTLPLYGQKHRDIFSKYLLLCSAEEWRSCGFGETWRWLNNDRILPLMFWISLDGLKWAWISLNAGFSRHVLSYSPLNYILYWRVWEVVMETHAEEQL